jgi:hypothetical protein
MSEVIAWVTFAGAWLLVAGPLYQGSVELDELDLDREGIGGIKESAMRAAPPPPSPWWWLLPPVMYLLNRRWNRTLRQATAAQLSSAQQEQLGRFRNKANGWLTVAAGAALLAAGETWGIVEREGWPTWLFWLMLVVMLAASVLNTALRMVAGNRQAHADSTTTVPAAD